MDWITNQIAIGNYLEAQEASLLQREAIGSVLGLTGALRDMSAAALGVRQLEIVPLVDGPGNDARLLRCALETLERLIKEAPPVLVHCHAGRSRSPIVVAAYLMRSQGLAAEEALACVAAKRSITVAPDLLRFLDTLD